MCEPFGKISLLIIGKRTGLTTFCPKADSTVQMRSWAAPTHGGEMMEAGYREKEGGSDRQTRTDLQREGGEETERGGRGETERDTDTE